MKIEVNKAIEWLNARFLCHLYQFRWSLGAQLGTLGRFFRVTLTMAMTSDTDNDTDGIHGNTNCYRGNIGAEKNMTT